MKAFLFFVFYLISITISAQFHVRGKVYESEFGDKLAQVIVQLEGTDICSYTDSSGMYKITIPEGYSKANLMYDKQGFLSLRTKVSDYYQIDVVLASLLPPEKHIEVGYGTQRSTDITGSVGTIGQGSYRPRSYVAQTKSLKSLKNRKQ